MHVDSLEIKLMVPKIQLPRNMNAKLYKAIESGNFTERAQVGTISTPIMNNNVNANSNFDEQVGTSLTGLGKMIFMLHNHFDNQEYSMF